MNLCACQMISFPDVVLVVRGQKGGGERGGGEKRKRNLVKYESKRACLHGGKADQHMFAITSFAHGAINRLKKFIKLKNVCRLSKTSIEFDFKKYFI